MELLRALQEIAAEGLVSEPYGEGCMGLCWKASQKGKHLDYGDMKTLFKSMGKDEEYPISVTSAESPKQQYRATAYTHMNDYNNDYLAARWYLLHEMINELELQ